SHLCFIVWFFSYVFSYHYPFSVPFFENGRIAAFIIMHNWIGIVHSLCGGKPFSGNNGGISNNMNLYAITFQRNQFIGRVFDIFLYVFKCVFSIFKTPLGSCYIVIRRHIGFKKTNVIFNGSFVVAGYKISYFLLV